MMVKNLLVCVAMGVSTLVAMERTEETLKEGRGTRIYEEWKHVYGIADENALLKACEKGAIHIVKYLVDQGADKEAQDKDGRTLLHWASYQGHVEVVKYLIEKEADKEVQDKNGRTPLHFASENGHVEVVTYLVEKGADKEAKTGSGFGFGMTPLHCASENGHVDVA